VEASGVAQFAGGPEDRRLRLVLLGPLSDQRLFCGWELASRTTATFPLRSTLDIYSQASDWGGAHGLRTICVAAIKVLSTARGDCNSLGLLVPDHLLHRSNKENPEHAACQCDAGDYSESPVKVAGPV
jgi:hypothetical protein